MVRIISEEPKLLILLGAAAGALIILAAAAVLLGKYIKKKKRAKPLSNNSYVPPLPVSNIIKDKKRKESLYDILTQTFMMGMERFGKKPVLRLTEVTSGTAYSLRLKKNKRAAIGRKRGSGIRLKDPAVSEVHCFVDFNGARVFIEDNNTLNGTILNGILIKTQMPVYTNDLVLIGSREYRIEVLKRA